MSELPWNTSGQPSICLTPGVTLVASPDHVYTELEGEAVILSLKNGVYYGLNAVGLRMWEMLQEPTNGETIIGTLMTEYEVERTECERDVIALLQDLADRGLIEVCP